ncbi:hypothetical protein [Clostridium cibarium]|uniref:NACHT domain-containing protein n=1 Tax=Clostridium cibarium TaxID=2762247 RepID=A0ABR8PPF4_9CLOT|nr:hypothetical protein [Clostridium cibarium]MBD7910035.1 hypothetical protein [Clostridium cibarium]
MCGEFGVGKTYAVDIMFQRQAEVYLNDLDDRFPIYLKINSIGNLREKIENEYFFDRYNKYIIFIDGLDELDYSLVGKIIDEIMFLEELWVNCNFIVTTRPMSLLNNYNIKYLPLLKDEEMVEIIECISGIDYEPTIGARLDKDIKETIERPFFCILFALSMKDKYNNFIIDRNKMIDYLVNNLIAKISKQKEKIYEQIIRLSIILVDNKFCKIHLSELGSNFDIDDLLKSGLIYKDDNEYLYFPLPIIPQWLSAEGIRLKYKDIDEIIESEEQVIKWRYPLSILFGKLSYNESKKFFAKIVSLYPGVASIIIRDGIKTIRKSNLPSASECGKMLQECMRKWIEGLGNFAYVIAPFRYGKIADLGVSVDGVGISVTWDQKSYNEDIKTFNDEELMFCGGVMRSHVPIAQSIWPWIDTLEYLSENLKNLIKQKPLMLEDGVLLEEYIWSLSCSLTKKGDLYDDVINISEIEEYRKYLYESNLSISATMIDMNFYFNEIDKLIDSGHTFISAPWPKHDVPYKKCGGKVWGLYSEQRILQKTIFIYDNAIKEYLRIVEKWFPLIKESLNIYNLLPTKLNGDIYINRKNEFYGRPTMKWCFEVLAKGEKSYVNFKLSDIENRQNKSIEEYSKSWMELRTKRLEKSEWINFFSGGTSLEIFGDRPITNLVFEWLESDLKNIGWIK